MWDKRFLDLAHMVSTWSKDPSTKVGCVLVNSNKQIVGTGYNGFPRNTNDDPDIYNDRPRKYLRVLHAEVNAVLNSVGSTKDTFAYVTHPCCSQCMALLIQAGVIGVMFPKPNEELKKRFKDSFEEALQLAKEANVKVVETDE